MFLPEVSIKRPVLATVMSLAIILIGVITFLRLPVREYPNIDAPVVSVRTVYPGASAEIMESQVTQPLEDSLAGIEGIRTIKSVSREEVSQITVEFLLERDVDSAANDVRDRVARVRGRLPDETDDPVVAKIEADAQAIMWLAFSSDRYSALEITDYADRVIVDRLQALPGVASVIIGGERRYAMRVWLDRDRMAAYGLTPQDVENALKRQNVELPSGRIESRQREFTVLTESDLRTPEQFNDLIIKETKGYPIRLRDIGYAEIGTGEVFHKAGLLVRVARMGRREDHGVSYADNALTVLPVTAGWMIVALGRAAIWHRCTGKDDDTWKWVPADPPARIARTLLEMAGEWRLPYLGNIIECPTLRRDGSVLEREGYDPETGLYFDGGGVEFAPIPARPTRAQAEVALAELADVVRDFPFEGDRDRSVFLSGALTVPVRHMLRDSPLHCFSASRPRAGKSFQADLCALIATGREAPAMNAADDASEEEKRIVSILLSGVPLALIDNIDEPLKSARLCSAITQATYSGRLLGVNRMVNLPTRLVWFASGNNLCLHDDLNPRALLGYLVPDTDRPEERQFDRDLKTWVVEQRPRLASAIITILRAYLCAGSPGQGLRGFGAAPDWSALVRSALVWLGRADPALTQERLRANDPVSTNLARLLQAWREAFGEQAMTTAEIVKAAHNKPDLVDVLLEVASKDGEKINTRSLGKYLGAHVNRIEGGLKLTASGLSHQSVLWRVRGVSNRPSANSPTPPNSRQPPPTEPATGELDEFGEFPTRRFETCSTCARYIASPCDDGGVCEQHESAVENPAVHRCGDWAAQEANPCGTSSAGRPPECWTTGELSSKSAPRSANRSKERNHDPATI